MGSAYAAVVVLHGGTKLALNIYRGWVTERTNRRLRLRTHGEAEEGAGRPHEGVRISIVVSEVEPIGGFVGAAISEPLLHAGALLSVFGYMLVLQPWMAVVVIGLFLPQGVFVPLMQRAINRRTRKRIAVLREMSGGIVEDAKDGTAREASAIEGFERCVERVYDLAMQILRRNVTLNFLMNGLHHLGTAGILLVGGWLVVEGRTEVGTVVAFISGLARIKDPWDDLVKFFQEATNARVKYRLLASALDGERRDSA
jgi:ABC-type bacteriocin/lantibiotic exporter with double-glycine peptidase domain